MVAYVVPPERMGIAYGILYCAMNFSYTIFPPILGLAQVHGGYNAAFFILFALGIFGLINVIWMYQEDKKYNYSVLQAKNPWETMGL